MGDSQNLSDDQKRRRVAEVLVKPLVGEGMVRRRGVSVEEHEKWIEGLKTRLAYMDPENLKALRFGIARAAGGTHRNQWPAILTITNMAHTIQFPPDHDSDMVVSYMASAAGWKAWNLGPTYAMALRAHLRKVRLVPNEFTWRQINQHGEELARKSVLVAERIKAGRASEADLKWIRGFENIKAHVKALVFAKKEVAA